MDVFWDFLQVGIVGNFAWGNLFMLAIGCLFIYLAIAKDYEPLLLVPIGFGMLVGVLTVIVRVTNPSYYEGVIFAILLACIFSPLIDYFVVERNIKRRMARQEAARE